MHASDVSLSVYSDNGSLPPRYRKSTRTSLSADGTLRVTQTSGYDGDGVTTERHLGAAVVHALIRDLRDLGLFSTAWAKPERREVGGGQWKLRVASGGEEVRIPGLVRSSQREARDQIRDRIQETFRADTAHPGG